MAAHTPRAARFCLHRRLRLTLSNSEKIALSIWLWQDAVWTSSTEFRRPSHLGFSVKAEYSPRILAEDKSQRVSVN
jgi:hypothetical protein